MIKVLVIDDSALMRKALRQALEGERGLEVRTARNGQDGLDQIADFDPTVITLDINMPVMDGLTCLSRIMVEAPRPVIMVSSLTEKGALATLEAMELGAVDYICKPGGTVSLNIADIFPDLIAKVKVAAGARLRRRRTITNLKGSTLKHNVDENRDVVGRRLKTRASIASGAVLIGVSTGGPRTLEEILPALPASFPFPVLVCQHMPRSFTGAYAKRLNQYCALEVVEVSRATPIQVGCVYIGRGDSDLLISRRGGKLVAISAPSSEEHLWHPSVERMVQSAMQYYPPERLIAVQLTGMGNDGVKAMTELNKLGGYTIAESEKTAVVFGMPKELIKSGGASVELPSYKVADHLVSLGAKAGKEDQ